MFDDEDALANDGSRVPFEVAVDKMIVSEEETTKFGEFASTDLGDYIKAIDQKIAHIAITTRTPKHYLLQSGQDPSGDAIKSAESGLVAKEKRKQAALGESFEEVFSLCRKLQGEETDVDSEVVWSDPATESEAARTDSAIKKFQAGLIPAEQALSDLGYSQTVISRIMRNKAADALLSAIGVPPGAPAVPGTPPTPPGVTPIPPRPPTLV